MTRREAGSYAVHLLSSFERNFATVFPVLDEYRSCSVRDGILDSPRVDDIKHGLVTSRRDFTEYTLPSCVRDIIIGEHTVSLWKR